MEEKKCCTIIQNYSCGCCGNGTGADVSKEVYSFDEIEIGTWVDGKPIYRKVIEGMLAATSGAGYIFANLAELNIDKIINLAGNFINNDRSQNSLPTLHAASKDIHAAVTLYYWSDTKDILYNLFNVGESYYGCTAYVIIEYTKQDDEPA